MSRIANLDDACSRRSPAGLRIPPQELKIHNRVVWCALDKLFEYRRPFLWAWDFVEPFKDDLFVNLVVPRFCFGSVGLARVSNVHRRVSRELTSWFTIQTISSGRVRVSPYVEGLLSRSATYA
jgi:hypothetical protein